MKSKRTELTGAEIIKVLKEKGRSMDAKWIAYNILKNRGEEYPGAEVKRLTPKVRKKCREMAEQERIDEHDMRRPVTFEYVSPAEMKERADRTAKRKKVCARIRHILSKCGFSQAEVDELTEFDSTVAHLSVDQLEAVFKGQTNGPRRRCDECGHWQDDEIGVDTCNECGEKLEDE